MRNDRRIYTARQCDEDLHRVDILEQMESDVSTASFPCDKLHPMDQLKEFIAHARKKGMDHATIRMLLLSSGWKEKDIAEAMTEESLEMPVPLPPDAGGARDAFFHLLTFVALYTTFISLCILFFNYINILFPDAATQTYPGDTTGMLSSIRWSIAAVIVAFPLFLWISRILVKEMQKHAEKAVSGVRRWLTYLTLFVTAAALMGDVITLVFYLLNGELSVRFVLKVLVVLILAGMTFAYYFLALRTDPKLAKAMNLHKSFGIGSIVIVLIAIIWGFILTGSPMTQRERQFDDRRVEDLRAIKSEIFNFVYEGKPVSAALVKPLPKTLEDVAASAIYQKLNLQDPENSSPYVYTVIDRTHYELCATFTYARSQTYDIFWNHEAGNHCFTIDVTNTQI